MTERPFDASDAEAAEADDPEALAPGTMVGEYRVEARLDAGGFGAVYRAVHPVIGKVAAVKVLRRAYSSDPEVSRRFVDEARAAHRIRHRNIVDIFGFGTLPDGRLHFVMDLLDGESLEARLRRGGPLSVRQVLELLGPIAGALEAAHTAGVVHRDLKPDNVFLAKEPDGSEVPKLLDFGIAKLVGDVSSARSRAGALMGTPLYMSPEQIEGEPVDFRSDLYSLGVMVFRMLTGQHPFVGKTTLATMVMHSRAPRPRASEVCPTLPEALDPVLCRFLAVAPAERPASAHRLLEELRAAAGVVPATERPDFDGAVPHGSPSDHHALSTGPTLLDPRSIAPPGATHQVAPELAAKSPDERAQDDLGAGDRPSDLHTLPSTRAGGATPRRWRALAVVATGFLAVGAAAMGLRSRLDDAPMPSPSATPAEVTNPLDSAGAMVACPIWEAEGVAAPGGWLGAVAAMQACEFVDTWLGAAPRRQVSPAELLDLPRFPSDGFPIDPYGAPDARRRSLSAAETKAQAVLDGRIERTTKGFSVELRLRTKEGRHLGESRAEGPVAGLAISQAVRTLVERKIVPRVERLPEAASAWFGTHSVEAAIASHELGAAQVSEVDLGPVCAEAKRWLGEDAASSPLRPPCEATSTDWSSLPPPAISRISSAKFAFTAYSLAFGGSDRGPADWRALQGELETRRQAETSTEITSMLALAEAHTWANLGDTERARASAQQSMKTIPNASATDLLVGLARGTDAANDTSAFGAAWSWGNDPSGTATDPELRLLYLLRSYEERGRTTPGAALSYVRELLSRDRLEDARAVASEYVAGAPEHRFAGDVLLSDVDATVARLGASIDRVVAGLTTDDWRRIEHSAVNGTLRRADVVGRTDVANTWLDRFVLPEGSPKYDPAHNSFIWPSLLALCVRADRARGKRCMKRFDELRARDEFLGTFPPNDRPLADGVRLRVDGDLDGAARAWRRVDMANPYFYLIVDVAVFDEIGDGAFASKVDQALIAKKLAHVAGAHPAHVREARRAAKRGDRARARELAKIVVDAWGRSDVRVPAVAEMQRLLER